MPSCTNDLAHQNLILYHLNLHTEPQEIYQKDFYILQLSQDLDNYHKILLE